MKSIKPIVLFTLCLLWLFTGCLQSCKTVKHIEKTKTVYDSSAMEENKNLKQVLAYEREMMAKEREQWNNTGITFYEQLPCPDTAKGIVKRDILPAKIIFDNGKLKSIEGNVKALNQSLFEKQSDLYDAYRTIDSLYVELDKKEESVHSEQKTEAKSVKRNPAYGWLLWFIPLLLLIGMDIESRFKILYHLKTIFYQLKFPL